MKRVYIQKLPETGLGFAIMNRVKRSAELNAPLVD